MNLEFLRRTPVYLQIIGKVCIRVFTIMALISSVSSIFSASPAEVARWCEQQLHAFLDLDFFCLAEQASLSEEESAAAAPDTSLSKVSTAAVSSPSLRE